MQLLIHRNIARHPELIEGKVCEVTDEQFAADLIADSLASAVEEPAARSKPKELLKAVPAKAEIAEASDEETTKPKQLPPIPSAKSKPFKKSQDKD